MEPLYFHALETQGKSKAGERSVDPGSKEGNSICTDQRIKKRDYSYIMKVEMTARLLSRVWF